MAEALASPSLRSSTAGPRYWLVQATDRHVVRLTTILFPLLHVPLGIAMSESPRVAEAHAIMTVVISVVLALGRRVDRVICAACYIAGAEVWWRMCHADIYWEVGKYAVVLLFLTTSLRTKGFRIAGWPLAYFALLVPSIALMPYDIPSSEARRQISFNLSGPLSLMVSALFMSQLHLGSRAWSRTVGAFLTPVVGVITVIVKTATEAPALEFTLESNKLMSGGFGPNQVSTILGLGATLAFLSVALGFGRGLTRVASWGSALVLISFAALTFSRGGVVAAVGASLIGALFVIQERRLRLGALAATVALIAVGNWVLLPRFQEVTQGKFIARFQSFETTGRSVLFREDLELFAERPLTGVGPGGSKLSHWASQAAHTEFSRMIAEHGILGVLSLCVLAWSSIATVRAARSRAAKARRAALWAWAFLTMMHSAMRLVAPALVIGLALVDWGEKPKSGLDG